MPAIDRLAALIRWARTRRTSWAVADVPAEIAPSKITAARYVAALESAGLLLATPDAAHAQRVRYSYRR